MSSTDQESMVQDVMESCAIHTTELGMRFFPRHRVIRKSLLGVELFAAISVTPSCPPFNSRTEGGGRAAGLVILPSNHFKTYTVSRIFS